MCSEVFRGLLGALCVGGAAQFSLAQCVPVDFENLAVGTAVTSQYEGVTFSVVPQSCGGAPTLFMRVASAVDGHACSSKVLLIDQGCPDFSSDYLRMVFDDPHQNVSFTLGPWYGTYAIRAYNAASGGSLILSQTVTLPGTGFVDVHRLVVLHSASANIRRVEVQETAGQFEAIDNLSFPDDTPPEVEITTPAGNACGCGTVSLRGISCETDGEYAGDVLEYRRIYPDVVADWTLADDASVPVCSEGLLYAWNTSDAEIVEGLYLLRVTATNACGLSASDETTIYVDKDFDTLAIHAPAGGAILGGNVCLDGTAFDEFCFDRYIAQYRPAAGGAWQPVDPAYTEYDATKVNEPLAQWAAVSGLVDGDYLLQLIGYTDCGNSVTRTISVRYDDTPPAADIASPASCSQAGDDVKFIGTAADANLLHWYLEWFDPSLPGWRLIDDGATSVVGGTLGTWDTSALAPCYYAVRLRVYDRSIVDHCGSADYHYSSYYTAIAVGDPCPGDIDGDGYVGLADLSILLTYFGLGCD